MMPICEGPDMQAARDRVFEDLGDKVDTVLRLAQTEAPRDEPWDLDDLDDLDFFGCMARNAMTKS